MDKSERSIHWRGILNINVGWMNVLYCDVEVPYANTLTYSFDWYEYYSRHPPIQTQ